VIISSPSGGGKSTVIRRLRERHTEFLYSLSVTTRPRRRGERNGVHYRFLPPEEFARLRSRRLLVEWATVHGESYGTPRTNLERAWRAKRVMLFDLDVQGAAQLRRAEPSVVTVFLQPPSMAVLRQRLSGRGSEDAAQRKRRLATAKREMKRRGEYDYLVTNGRLAQCVSDCEAIIRAEILRQRQDRKHRS
jgi:guanylate kinase